MTITHEILMETLSMFAFLAVELTLLFLVISYFVGVLQAYIPPSKIQSILSSKNGKGYLVAAFLGAITPFCSCSTIPFLKGLIRARAGFGAMLVFLFASPLLNPIIIGLFVFTFGWQVAAFYFAIAMSVSVFAGYVLEKLGFERFIREEAYAEPAVAGGCSGSSSSNACGSSDSSAASTGCGVAKQAPENKWLKIWNSTWKDFKKVLPYLLVGVALGSLIYGFMPTEFIARFADESNPFAIPVAAVIGIPLYIKAELVIPLSAALTAKGMSLGAVMALIIGSAGASLTEVILLKSIFKSQMVIAFLVVVLGMAVSAGYIYAFIF